MDQRKIGIFLKTLRKEKELTQEQFAEIMSVSGRTVSRWETGSNLPDIDLLIQIADYYNVELREILDGERKDEMMNEELRETALKVADYNNEDKKRITKRICALFFVGIIAFTSYVILEGFGITDTETGSKIADFSLGFAYGIMVMGTLYTSGCLLKIKAFKSRLLKRN